MESNEDLSWRLPILLCDLDHRGVLEHHGIFRLCPRTIGGTQGTVGLKQNVVLLAVCDELFLVEVRMAFTLQHSWLDGACTDDQIDLLAIKVGQPDVSHETLLHALFQRTPGF